MFEKKPYKLFLGDCIDALKGIEENSVDALVSDPPYGWRFMGKAWDGADIEKMFKRDVGAGERKLYPDGKYRTRKARPAQAAGKYDLSTNANVLFQKWTEEWAREAFRVCKPGAYALIFCGPRTYHRMASGVEDAGFEVRDQLQWIFGSGFPKSLNLGDGWGTALKPANEPIVLARKPLSEKTVAKNVAKWGTGGLNIGSARIEVSASDSNHRQATGKNGNADSMFGVGNSKRPATLMQGRFPSNVLLDEKAASLLDEQSGSSRFFYIAKTSKHERNAGLEELPLKKTFHDGRKAKSEVPQQRHSIENQNNHPTVKPFKLMRYLIRLVTPVGGVVLDPFLGSGTTGAVAVACGFKFIGVEKEKDYLEIARARIRDVKLKNVDARLVPGSPRRTVAISAKKHEKKSP